MSFCENLKGTPRAACSANVHRNTPQSLELVCCGTSRCKGKIGVKIEAEIGQEARPARLDWRWERG